MDFIDRNNSHFNRKTAIYQHRNCNAKRRERFWDILNEHLINASMSVGSSGECNGNKHLGLPAEGLDWQRELRGRTKSQRWEISVARYSEYEFSVNIEHNFNQNGYVTEKITDGLLADTVPIYGGATFQQISEIYNSEAFLYVTGENMQEVAGQVIKILGDDSELRRKQRVDAVTEDGMRRFFSWHPAVWNEFGDQLRQDIWSHLRRLCLRGRDDR